MPSLSETDRRLLLELARQSLTEAVSRRRAAVPMLRGGVLEERRGVFVTLQLRRRLRGCIGIVEPYEPLSKTIPYCAASAALQDPRFPPIEQDEVAQIQIEISLLSPPAPICPEEIEIGKHGLLVSNGASRGLLLPQVAVEHRLDRQGFLEETCRKAGLLVGAWEQAGTVILGFTCEVFSEKGSFD